MVAYIDTADDDGGMTFDVYDIYAEDMYVDPAERGDTLIAGEMTDAEYADYIRDAEAEYYNL